MNYCDIIKQSPSGGEKGMWKGVERVSEFLEEMRKKHPHEVKCFLKDEYFATNGKHLNETVAMQLVSKMYHTENGKKVKGELIRPETAEKELLKGENKGDEWYWDAYVAANAMMHDLANTGLNESEIMNVARHFFFHDDDYSEENKVFSYFEDSIF